MKKNLGKMNIGVVIAIVLFIITAAYVIVLNVSFSSKENGIKSFVKTFADDCCEANIGDMDTVTAKQRELVGKYFSGYETKVSERGMIDRVYTNDYMDQLYSFRSVFERHETVYEQPGEITECNAELRSIDVQKHGMNCAKVSASFIITMKTKGSYIIYSACGFPTGNQLTDESGQMYKDAVFETVEKVNIEFILSPDNDSWKIDAVSQSHDGPTSFNAKLISGEPLDPYFDEEEGGKNE